MKWIIRYVLSREVYRKYSENRDEIWSHITFEKVGNLAWTIIFIAIIVSLTFSYSKRSDLNTFELEEGDSLFVKPWQTYVHDEVPFYRSTMESTKSDTSRSDTGFYYQFTLKLDSSFNGESAVGVHTGRVFQTIEGTFVGIDKDDSVLLTEPHSKDFGFSNSKEYSTDLFVELNDIRKGDTKQRERLWFRHFVFMLICYFAFKRAVIALLKLFKRSMPVYEREAISKRDNRYKSGSRIVGYKSVIKEYRPMSAEELDLHKNQQITRLVLSGIILLISSILLILLYQTN